MATRVGRAASGVAGVLIAGALAAGCLSSAEDTGTGESSASVTVLTSSATAIPDRLGAAFERQTGIEMIVREVPGDATALADRLLSTDAGAGADVVVGLDEPAVLRGLAADLFEAYTSPEANQGQQRYPIDSQQRLSAVDLAITCVVLDAEAFEQSTVTEPETFTDLLDPEYAELLVIPSPLESRAGMDFLLATIAEFGADEWQDYWSELLSAGAHVTTAVGDQDSPYPPAFSQGRRSITAAPASSPAARLTDDDEPRTAAVQDMCYQRVRYAGVLKGTEHPERAHRVVDFLLAQQFQESLPDAFGSYPTRERVSLPRGWEERAPQPRNPLVLPADEVHEHSAGWLDQWQAVIDGS